ncbi:MAG: UDP-3-O-(3-hydroxymyristoyl)glucosamine N-acyltransferase [Verrucomicrobiota bacterium]
MFNIADIAKQLHGEIIGDASAQITGFARPASAEEGDLTFAESEKFFVEAEASAATAIIVDDNFESEKKILIRVKNARIAFARVLPLFFPEQTFEPGIHATAAVHSTAQIDPSAYIGPHCVIGERVKIGPLTVLQSGNDIGADSVIGEETRIFPNVTMYRRTQIGNRVRIHSGTVIGSDGFGYVYDSGFHRKIPQTGNVVIYDDVEIGANVTIDRGALGPTTIGKGTKIDNMVQIAHNVTIGDHCLIIAQAGIAGSSQLGNFVTVAGQAGIAGHLKIGNKVTISGKSGIMYDIPDGQKWFGSPIAAPDREMKRQLLAAQQLPELIKRVAELEKKLLERLESAPD